jgi:predicted transcriptional regulator
MTENEILDYLLTDSTALQVLRSVQSNQPQEATENRCDFSKSVLRERLATLRELGIIEETESSHQITGLGAMILHTVNQISSQDQDIIRNILSTQHWHRILRVLDEQPKRKTTLSTGPEGPSQSTVHRRLRDSEIEGLVTRNSDGLYKCTPTGTALLRRIDTLEHRIDLITDHESLLHKFSSECADFPVTALTDVRLVEGSPGQAFAERNAYVNFMRQLDVEEIDHIRQFASFFDVEMRDVYWPFVESGTQVDLVSPERIRDQLPTTRAGIRYAQRGFAAENVSWYIYPDTIPVGIVLFDDQWAVVGIQEPFGAKRSSATIFTQNEQIIDWALDVYLSCRSEARPPTQHLFDRFHRLRKQILD